MSIRIECITFFDRIVFADRSSGLHGIAVEPSVHQIGLNDMCRMGEGFRHCVFVGKEKNKRRFMENLAAMTSGILVAPAE